MMICPHCTADNDRVLDSRSCEDGRAIRRRRACNFCKKRFTTYERVDQYALQVVKKDNCREAFSREKIEQGLEKACWKRPVSRDQIRDMAAQVEADIQSDYDTEIPSNVIGHMVMQRLADLDQVAYVRFASVYREFKDVEDFVAELAPLRTNESLATDSDPSSPSGGQRKRSKQNSKTPLQAPVEDETLQGSS